MRAKDWGTIEGGGGAGAGGAVEAGPGEESLFLSAVPASPLQQRAAAVFFLASLLGFVLATPFARVSLPRLPALVAIDEAVLITVDLITMVLLYGQFLVVRSRALLVLTSGYLFEALITSLHLLTFPGVLAPTGLLGAGSQTTAWLYWFWHSGFLIAVIGYTLVDGPVRGHPIPILFGAVLAVAAAAGGMALLATAGAPYLPRIMVTLNQSGRLNVLPAWGDTALGLLALALLLRAGPRTMLNLSLMGVVWASMLDVMLAGFFATARFQVAFYVGRAFGLLASSLLLIALVTNIGLVYRRAVASARAADEANRSKGRFLAAASHDLRQPLQSLSLFAGALRGLVSDERAAMAVAGQEQAVATMTELLDALLDISKLDSGKVNPLITDVTLGELFDRLRVEFAGLAAAKGLRFEVTGCTDVARSDPILLGRILRNLIGNAIRYTERGTVRLGCEREGKSLRIEVADTGIGIGPEDMRHIFEEFYQVGVPPNATREGYGLGLPWAQRAARVLGSEIRVRSRPGAGSVFSIVLTGGSPEGVA